MSDTIFDFKSSNKRIRASAARISKNKKDKDISGFKIGDKSKFDIETLVEEVMGRDATRPVDLVVDDSEMLEAPNYVTFLTDERYLGINAWARQLEVGTRLFGDWCPACSDLEWFTQPEQFKLAIPKKASLKEFTRHVQLMEFDLCPKCKAHKSRFMRKKDGRLPYFNELVALIGQRGSKSAMVGMHKAYQLHKYLKMQRPTQMLGLLKSTILHFTSVALTFDQARENLWDPFMNLIDGSPWFHDYHSLLLDKEAATGEKLFKKMDTFIVYRHRNLHLNPSGPNMRTLRGRTRVGADLDELGWFDNEAGNQKVKMNADQVYKALERSLLTVRAAAENLLRKQNTYVVPALMQNASSPSSPRDKMMMLLKDAESNPYMFGVHHATWEFNPNLSRKSASIVAAFRTNALDADRDYGANPPLSSNPFFDSIEVLENAQAKKRNGLKLLPRKAKRNDGSKYSFAEILAVNQGSGRGSILSLDAGYTNNSFAFTIQQFSEKFKGRIEIPILGEIIPEVAHPVNFSRVYDDVLAPLIEKRNVQYIVADRWNSIKLLQDACRDFPHLTYQIYSLSYEEMVLVKEHIESGKVKWPRAELDMKDIIQFDPSAYPKSFEGKPVAHMMMQMLTIRNTGTDVLKGDGLTDDIWRALALGTARMQDSEVAKIVESATIMDKNVALGTVFSRSSGGGQGNGHSPSGAGFYSPRGA